MPVQDTEAAVRRRWRDVYDIGWVAGEWWALRLDGKGDPVGPAGTPGDLDAMIEADHDSRGGEDHLHLPRPPRLHLPPMSAAWRLEPRDAATRDPNCPHCRIPGYPHRHWYQVDTPAEPKPDNWFWRAMYRLWLPVGGSLLKVVAAEVRAGYLLVMRRRDRGRLVHVRRPALRPQPRLARRTLVDLAAAVASPAVGTRQGAAPDRAHGAVPRGGHGVSLRFASQPSCMHPVQSGTCVHLPPAEYPQDGSAGACPTPWA